MMKLSVFELDDIYSYCDIDSRYRVKCLCKYFVEKIIYMFPEQSKPLLVCTNHIIMNINEERLYCGTYYGSKIMINYAMKNIQYISDLGLYFLGLYFACLGGQQTIAKSIVTSVNVHFGILGASQGNHIDILQSMINNGYDNGYDSKNLKIIKIEYTCVENSDEINITCNINCTVDSQQQIFHVEYTKKAPFTKLGYSSAFSVSNK